MRFVRTYLIPTQYDSLSKKIRKAQADFINRKKRAKVRTFWKRNIILERVRRLEDTISKDGMSVTYVCGSDQIWNPQFQPNTLFYLDSQALRKDCCYYGWHRDEHIRSLSTSGAFLVVCIHAPFPGKIGEYFTSLTRIAVPIFL